MADKVKLHKNAERSKPTKYEPYVPQYQVRGIEPEKVGGNSAVPIAIAKKVPLPSDNPRASRPVMRQSYAETTTSPLGIGKGPIPNVGNNMEQTWSSIDGDLIDDMELDPNQTMIDNNEFVDTNAWEDTENVSEVETKINHVPLEFSGAFELEDDEGEYLSQSIQNLDEDEYLLVMNGMSICYGNSDYIQEQVRGLVYGEHPLCHGTSVSIDDIVVVKRVKIKIGLFLE
jgi:hypothetical protein